MGKILLILLILSTNIYFAQQQTIDSIINIGGCILDPEMPEFIGGNDSLKKFISKHFNLAVDKNCNEGRIYLKFAIEEDGSLTNIKVIRGLSVKLDTEAIRVISIMPKWKPARSNGKPIRMFMNLPLKVG
jgi:TonB family protein